MFDSNRNRALQLLGIAVTLVVIVSIPWAAYDIGASVTERNLRAENNTSTYASKAENGINLCIAEHSEPSDIAECVKQQVEAAEKARRDEYDLTAQEDMAEFAFWLMWVSIATVGVTSIGVYFVWLTLKETAAGVLVMRNEQRPWLKFEVEPLGEIIRDIDGSMLDVVVKSTVFNEGGAPATNVVFSSKVVIDGKDFGYFEPKGIYEDVVFRDGAIRGPGVWTAVGDFPLPMSNVTIVLKAEYRSAKLLPDANAFSVEMAWRLTPVEHTFTEKGFAHAILEYDGPDEFIDSSPKETVSVKVERDTERPSHIG